MRTRHYPSIAVCIICLAIMAAPALAVETFTLKPQRAPVQPVIQASPELTPYEVEQREKAIDVLYQERRARYTLAKDPTAGGVLYRSPQTTARADLPAAPGTMRAPGDFTFFRTTTMTDVFTNNSTSSTNEPSLGMSCSNVVYTGNWYGSISNDGGQTFTFVNPATFFPTAAGGFCCDQVVYYEPSRGIFCWYLQYTRDGSNNNIVRLAISDNPTTNLADWWWYDISPQDLGYATSNNFDFPDLSASDNFLYITTNFGTGSTTGDRARVIRLDLDDLANAATASGASFASSLANVRCTHGAAGTMYVGTQVDDNTLRIFSWTEAGALASVDRDVDQYFTGSSAPSPDGTDWVARDFNDILTAWVAAGRVGFMWGSAQGDGFAWPNVRYAVFNEGGLGLADQGQIWNDDFAWAYPAVHPNDNGDLGGVIGLGGGGNSVPYPSVSAWLADDYNGDVIAPLESYFVSQGDDGPDNNRWGDYYTARRNDPFGHTWVASAHVLRGGGGGAAAEPHFTWFGREANAPAAVAITCPGDISVECSQHGGTPATDPAIVAFLAGASASGGCGTITITHDAPSFFDEGTTTVTFTATDELGGSDQCTADVTIVDTTPPVIVCPADIVVECSSHCGVAEDDTLLIPFFDGVSATDVCDDDVAITNDAPDCFPLGETTVTFTATDDAGLTTECTATVTVEDTTPPEIDVVLDRDVLWPPNHKLATVCATVTVTDICDPDPTWVLFGAVSDEPENDLGDGHTTDDIQGDVLGTADECIELRSERMGGEDGRKYTIYYQAMDMSGNVAYDTVCVRVPHDQGSAALASTGFSLDGKTFTGASETFAVVIPTTDAVDAAELETSRIYLGNTAGVIRPAETRVVDVNADGHVDLALFYRTEAVDVLVGASTSLDLSESGSSLTRERGDGPLGIHYTTRSGVDYLVGNIFALGTPVEMPGVWLDITPPLDVPEVTDAPKATALSSIHPNPFNPQTTVAYTLLKSEQVRIAIYDVRGSLVRRLVDDSQPAGGYQAVWNGADDAGRPATSGVYFVRMIAGSYSETRKIVLLK
ncbi:MAG TPA: HYR domain-containing protein [Candidatus Krumholzibacteria bacterium]|nr:HYR domain-containing protein [Candidatus Krumholzibacteria bacterium]